MTSKFTVKRELNFFWTCSECGKENHDCHKVEGISGNYCSFFYDRDSISKKEADAKLDKAKTALVKHKYHRVHIDCMCRNCKHREPWAKFRYQKVDEYAAMFILMSSGLFLLMLLGGISRDTSLFKQIWSGDIIVWSVMMSWFVIIKPIYIFIRNKQIQKLPTSALPELNII